MSTQEWCARRSQSAYSVHADRMESISPRRFCRSVHSACRVRLMSWGRHHQTAIVVAPHHIGKHMPLAVHGNLSFLCGCGHAILEHFRAFRRQSCSCMLTRRGISVHVCIYASQIAYLTCRRNEVFLLVIFGSSVLAYTLHVVASASPNRHRRGSLSYRQDNSCGAWEFVTLG